MISARRQRPLTDRQRSVLAAVCSLREPSIYPDLLDALGWKQSEILRVLESLEKRGFVTRLGFDRMRVYLPGSCWRAVGAAAERRPIVPPHVAKAVHRGEIDLRTALRRHLLGAPD